MTRKRTHRAPAAARDDAAADEVVRLRRLLSDLTALSALPIFWIARDPSQILDSLLDTLVRTLQLDVAYVHVKRTSMPALEAAAPRALGPPDLVRRTLGLGADGGGLVGRTALLADTAPVHLADVRFQAPGVAGLVVVGARRAEFPTEDDQFLLRTATNQGAMALRQAELVAQLRLADRQKNDFIARLGHELRNPLGPILNGAEFLDRPDIDPAAARRAAALIHRQATHMSRMIDDLLDVARIAHGSIGLRLERIDLVALLRSAVEDRRSMFEALELRVTTALPDEPVWADVDPVRMTQIFANLLVNAGKFTPPGGSVTVVLDRDAASGDALIDITDTGMGLEPDQIAALFEPFTQARPDAPRGQPGLGLGLPLARGLAQMHGGDLMARSDGPGHGAGFTLRLPAASEGPEVVPVPPSPTAIRFRRVLIVDDNDDVAESLKLLVESLGHEVHVARTGNEALAMTREDPPDLVLCDLGMPAPLDGLALAREFRGDANIAAIPLIAVTGYGTEDDRRRSREAGFDLHLTKPVSIATLEEVLSTVGLVDQRKAGRR